MGMSFQARLMVSSLLSMAVWWTFSSTSCYGQNSSTLMFEVVSIRPAVFPNDAVASGFAAGAASNPCALGKVVVSGTLIT